MKVTEFTRNALRTRRELRDLPKEGWEPVDESGGRLWEIARGYRYDRTITDVRISASGKFLWVKVGTPCRNRTSTP